MIKRPSSMTITHTPICLRLPTAHLPPSLPASPIGARSGSSNGFTDDASDEEARTEREENPSSGAMQSNQVGRRGFGPLGGVPRKAWDGLMRWFEC